ncbi:hypothetical protein V3851_16505 [Paenibacillus sp. M1]|uniref:Uncharacterized protein n=1 Tax=Paenibacillus haidiansis TaxID=1574488 RepID=A0ABU7VUJ8_9BACL
MYFKATVINSLKIEELSNTKFKLIAESSLPTKQWSDLRLIPYSYNRFPQDGFYEFDLIAEFNLKEEEKMDTQSLIAEYILEDFSPKLRGARVFSSNNFLSVKLENIITNDSASVNKGHMADCGYA